MPIQFRNDTHRQYIQQPHFPFLHCFASAAPPFGLLAAACIGGCSVFCGADCTGSEKISWNIPGKNLSIRFPVSSHNLVFSGFSDGGTKYPPFAMTRRIFFRLSETASSYDELGIKGKLMRQLRCTNQAIPLPTIHQAIHNIQNPQPQLQHPIPLTQQHQIMQENLTQQRRRLHSCLAHADGIGMVDFRA